MMAANGKMHALAIALVLAGTGCAHGAAQAHVQHGAVSIKFGASGDVVRFDPLLLSPDCGRHTEGVCIMEGLRGVGLGPGLTV
jgi:hypothetical protein